MSIHRRLYPVILLTAALCRPASAKDPHIGYIYPAGAQRGASVTVTVGGQFLEGATNIMVTGEGIRAEVAGYFKELTRQEINRLRNRMEKLSQTNESMEGEKQASMEEKMEEMKQIFMEQGFDESGRRPKKRPDPKKQPNMQIREQVTLRFSVDRDAASGVREIRLLTGKGLSNPMVFHVGNLPELNEVEPNDLAPAEALQVTLPAVVNGRILPGDVDLFHFPAVKGQRLLFKAEARSLVPYLADAVPGWFQATLALYDPNGNEVAYVDDHKFDPDPVLAMDVEEDGEYVLEIKDAIYRGREDFVYRIAMSKPRREKPAPLPPVPGGFHGIPETEGNNDLATAQVIEITALVEGCIDRPGDWDVFRFRGYAGDKIVAEVSARRCGSPLDSVLKLTAGGGAFLQVNDDHVDRAAGLTTHHADSCIDFSLPVDGEYAIHLGDIQNQGSPEHFYRLRVGTQKPGFDLMVTPSTINIPAGGTVPVTVHALRRDGFDGRIVLSLLDPPRGFKLNGGVMPPGADKVRVTLTAPWKPGQTELTMKMEGKASIGGKTVKRKAVPAEDMMQAFLWTHLVPAGEWAIAVTGPAKGAIVVDLPDDGIIRIPAGGRVDLMLHAANRKRMGGRPRFELDEPPDGLSLAKAVVRPERNEALLVVEADAEKLAPGTRGNLIVNALAPNKKRSLVLGVAPAIPFVIVSQ